MIIKFINGSKLMVSTNSGEVYLAAERLKTNGIECEYDTMRSKGLLMTRYTDMSLQSRYGITQSQMGPSESKITHYRLFVRRKDVKRAKEVLGII